MPGKTTLNIWMLENRWTNTTMASRMTECGYRVHHSTISQIRHKKLVPSGKLAKEIHYFTCKEVSLEEILSVE